MGHTGCLILVPHRFPDLARITGAVVADALKVQVGTAIDRVIDQPVDILRCRFRCAIIEIPCVFVIDNTVR